MSRPPQLIELRAGTARDLATVNAIMQEAFDPRFGEAWTKAQCLGMLSLPDVWLTLAAVDGADLGFALARSTGPDAELLLLAIRPAARRRGIGGALLRATIAEARSRDSANLFLEVRAGNDAAHLYLREGFTSIGHRKDYYRGRGGQLFDAQTFSRKLD